MGVVTGGTFMVLAIILFGLSFGELAVNKCVYPNENATLTSNPPCESWQATMPSVIIEGEGNAECRICPPNVAPFTMATSCKFGWGGIFAIAACVLAFLSTCCGYRIRPKLTLREKQH